MIRLTRISRSVLVIALTMITLRAATLPARSAATAAASALPCADAPRRALADVADAVTRGSDAGVLTAALRARTRLARCGLTREAVSAELIAADAYGDVKQPQMRCRMLRAAHATSLRTADYVRARTVQRALRDC